jgi:hypothetical protein
VSTDRAGCGELVTTPGEFGPAMHPASFAKTRGRGKL